MITGHKAGRGVIWKLDSQSYGDLLRAYGSVLGRHGSEHPVAVLIDDALSISWIWVAPALANKTAYQCAGIRGNARKREDVRDQACAVDADRYTDRIG